MKGKIVFVLGAAVGYVLGTRAGRERYEQIKRGAQRVWNTEPVQQGVHLVKDAVDERAEELKDFALRFGGDVFSTILRGRQSDEAFQTANDPEPAEPPTKPEAAPKSSAAQSSAAQSSASKSSGSAQSSSGAKSSGTRKPASGAKKSGGSRAKS